MVFESWRTIFGRPLGPGGVSSGFLGYVHYAGEGEVAGHVMVRTT